MIRVTRKILRLFSQRERYQLIGIFIMMVVGGCMESLSISLLLPLVHAIVDSDNWAESSVGKALGRIIAINSHREYIIVLIVALIAIFIIKNIYLIWENYVQCSFVFRTRVNLQNRMMKLYISKPYSFFLDYQVGEAIRVTRSDPAEAFSLVNTLLNFYTEAIVSFALGFTLILVSTEMFLFVIALLLAEIFVVFRVLRPRIKSYGEKNRSEGAMANQWVLEIFSGIKSIKVSNKEKYFYDNFETHSNAIATTGKKQNLVSSMPRFVIETVTMVGILAYLLIYLIKGGAINAMVPQLSAFAVAAARLLPSANRMSLALNSISFSEGALDNVLAVCSETHGQSAAFNANSLSEKLKFENKFECSDISFSYSPGGKEILDKTSLSIKRGEAVGIVGKSGAGKTTLIDIMLGLLKPTAGDIKVDGQIINDNMNSLRNITAYIPQTIFLMNGTIRNNVVFGNDEGADDDVWNALENAELADFVRSLSNGLDTIVGENGIRLSGGQRQRIGIARALYNNPEILVFDEATSALDNETERAIIESIDHLMGKKTIVIVAHRLTTIANCDVVFEVSDGKVIKRK